MDSGSLLIGAIMLALCVVPILFIGRSRKKHKKKLLNSLLSFAESQNCNITQHELCGKISLGLAEDPNYFFFVKHSKEKVTKQYVNLTEIQNCKVINTSTAVGSKAEKIKVLDKLEMSFVPHDKSKQGIIIQFFDVEEDVQLTGELQLIEKWSKLINHKLKPHQGK